MKIKNINNSVTWVIFILTTMALFLFLLMPFFYWFENPELTQMEVFKECWESFILSPFFIIVYYLAYFEKTK